MKPMQTILAITLAGLIGACTTTREASSEASQQTTAEKPTPRTILDPFVLKVHNNTGLPIAMTVGENEMPELVTTKGKEVEIYGTNSVRLRFTKTKNGVPVNHDRLVYFTQTMRESDTWVPEF
jgi:hypothetical protein